MKKLKVTKKGIFILSSVQMNKIKGGAGSTIQQQFGTGDPTFNTKGQSDADTLTGVTVP